MYYVYLLKLNSVDIYTGSTPNLEERLAEHEKGYVKSKQNLRPLKLIWYGAFPDRLSARRFKNYLKTGSGQAFRNKRLVK